MAQIQWYLRNQQVDGWQELSLDPQAGNYAIAGWVVGTGLTNSSEFASSTVSSADRASTTFVNTTPPDGTLNLTLHDAYRSPLLNGTFASGNWVLRLAITSPTQGGAADGQIVFRLLKGSAADGSNATEFTAGPHLGALCTNITVSDTNSGLTLNPGAVTFNNEYLFIQVAWKRTGAGGMTTTNIRPMAGVVGGGTNILTADFTVYVPPAQAVTTVAITSTATLQVPTTELPPVLAVTGATIVCSTSAVSYWPLDDPAGSTVARDLVGAQTGTFRGDVVPGQPGIAGSLAMKFGGYGSGVIMPKPLPGLFPAFTIEAWGQITEFRAYPARHPILARLIWFHGEWHCAVGSGGGVVYISAHDGVTGYVSAGAYVPTPLNEWGHFVLTGNGTTCSTYHNGVYIETDPFAIPAPGGAGPIHSLGCFGEITDSESWVGSLQDIAFYQRELTPEEIAAHYALRLSGTSAEYQQQVLSGGVFPPSVALTVVTGTISSAGPAGYWPLDDPEGSLTARDLVGTRTAGTVANAVTFGLQGLTAETRAAEFDSTNGTQATAHIVCQAIGSIAAGFTLEAWELFTLSEADWQVQLIGRGGYHVGSFTIQVRALPTYPQLHQGSLPAIQNLYAYNTTAAHGVWHHVVWTYDGVHVRAYIDGVSVIDPPTATAFPLVDPAAGEAVILGNNPSYNYGAPWNTTVRLHDVVIYTRALTPEEIVMHYTLRQGASSAYQVKILSPNVFAPTVEVGIVAPPEDQAIDGGTIASTAQVRVPSATPGLVTITTQPRASALQTFAMAIAVGAVAIAGGTRTATAQSYVPTVVPQAVTVTGATRATTAAVNAATVTPGPVSITSATRASLSQVFVASVTTGPVSVTAATRASTISVFIPVVSLSGVSAVETVAVPSACLAHAPTVTVGAASVTSGFITSISQSLAPSVTTVTSIQTGMAPSMLVLNAPVTTVGPVSITAAHRASALSVNEPIVALAGVLNIGAVTVPTTAILRTATVTTGPVIVTAAHRSTTISTAAPTVIPGIVSVTAATIPTQVQVRIPSVGVGPASVTTAQIPTTAILREPIVSLAGVVNVGTVSVASTATLLVPSLSVGSVSITTQPVTSTLQVHAPVVTPAGVQVVGAAFISSTVVVRVPILVTGPVSVTNSTCGPVSVAHAPVIAVAGIQAVSLSSITTSIALTSPSIALGPVGVIAPHISATSSLSAPMVVPGAATVGVTHRASTAILNQPSLSAGAITIIGTHLPSTSRLSASSVVNEGAPGFPEIRTAELVSLLANTMKVQLQTGLLTSQLAYILEPALEASSLVVLIPTRILVEVA